MATRIPSEVKKIVTFIFVRDSRGEFVPNGTGFFVGVKSKDVPELMHAYLVTVKHVLQDKSGSYYPSVFIRLNKKAGGAGMIELVLRGQNAVAIHMHEDSTVDLAVLPILPSTDVYEFKALPDDMLTTKESFKEADIREGDEVFFTGLFTSFFGAQRNYPVARFGRVALVTEEKIPWKNVMLDLYLIECQSFGGNSGSPVFFYLGVTREPGSVILGGTKLLLAGVMKGSFLDAKEVMIAETSPIALSLENVGIAAVVPSYRLHEILFSDALREARGVRQ